MDQYICNFKTSYSIEPDSPFFLKKVEEQYGHFIVSPRKNDHEVLCVMQEEYGMESIDIKDLDEMTCASLIGLPYSDCQLWVLPRNNKTDWIYDILYKRFIPFGSGIKIIGFYQNSIGVFYSNSDVLEYGFSAFRGIDTSDISSFSEVYRAYLNRLFLLGEALKE